jgi:hypothetical protein
MSKGRQIQGFIIVILLIVSCKSHYTKNETILRAESLLNTSPDSAYQLLTSIPHPEKLSRGDYAAWCLQYTHAQYKLYKDIKSDSIIRVAVKYYRKKDLPIQSGTAYYLLGCISKLQSNNKNAMKAYKKAQEILKLTDENDMKGLVDYNIGRIYMQDELYVQSLIYLKQSLKYFARSKNTKYMAYSYREISNMYHLLNYPFSSVINYSNKALKLSEQAGDSLNYYSILSRQGELLYDKDYVKSKNYILQGYRYFQDQRPYYAAYLSFIYSRLNNTDSAKYFLQVSLTDTVNPNLKVIKYLAAAYVTKSEKNNNKSFMYFEKAYANRDSIFQQNIHSQIYRIDKQFDLSRKEEENAALKLTNRNNVILITLLIILVMLGFIIFLLMNSKHKKKQAMYLIEKQRLEFEIRTKYIENTQKRNLLVSNLHNRAENTLRLKQLNVGLSQQEKQEAFMEEITKQSILSEKEWQYYIDEVNSIFDNKIVLYSKVNPLLTKSDLLVIALICIGMDIADSCNLLNMTKNAMYHRRKIIRERIGLDKEVDLSEWIMQNFVFDFKE